MYGSAVTKAAEKIRQLSSGFSPEIGIILGSGLGALADKTDAAAVIPYGQIPGFPVSTVKGHSGRLVLGSLAGKRVAVMQGRVHYYEGYTMEQAVMPVRVMRELGVKTLLITNAAGAINLSYKTGDFVAITDHICLAPNPLIGKNDPHFGLRFPDMTHAYNQELTALIIKAGAAAGIEVKKGVYCQVTGPSFETPAEIRMMRLMGADLVGMSTAVECIAANHAGLRVCGISLAANPAAGVTAEKLSSAEVDETGERSAPRFEQLVTGFLRLL